MNRPPDTAAARDDVAAAGNFRARLDCAYALSDPQADSAGRRDGRPLLVNVIDPASQLLRASAADLRAALLAPVDAQSASRLAFSVLELDLCAGSDALAQEALAQILFAFDAIAAPSEAERRIAALFSDVRRDLLPWSPSSLYELERWAARTLADRPLVLALRGADLLDTESAARAVRIAQAVAGSVRARLLFVLSERRHYDCDVRILNPPPDRSRFEEEIVHLLQAADRHAGGGDAQEQSAGSDNGARGFWRRFTDWVWPATRTGTASDQGEVAGLICAATYPSYRLRDRALHELEAYAHGVRSAAMLSAPNPDAATDAARAALFLKLLEVAFPKVMHATQSQPDGYHRLYRLQLALVPQGHRTESIQTLIAPEWIEFSRDPRLRAFFAYAMSEIGRDEPRVRPFVSATAIKRHLLGLMDECQRPGSNESYRAELASLQEFCESVAGTVLGCRTMLGEYLRTAESERAQAVDELVAAAKDAPPQGTNPRISAAVAKMRDVEIHLSSVKELLEGNIRFTPARELGERLSRIKDLLAAEQQVSQPLEAGDTIEQCLRHLAFLELEESGDIERSARERIDSLRKARDLTDGALGLDADLGIARAYSLLGEADQAKAALDAATAWAGDDPLGRAAVDLGKAFLNERKGETQQAEEMCLDVLNRADALGARELTARAAYGVMRCRVAGANRPEWQSFFRTRAFLSIQAARSPFLAEVVHEATPRLFISYRRAQEDVVRRLREQFAKVAPTMNIWVDFEAIDEQHTEFRPAMQLGLDLSDAVLLVFSPEYFESPWCSYELTTSIARRRLSGQQVFWMCVDPTASGDPRAPREHVRKIAQRAATSPAEQAFFETQLAAVLDSEPAYGSVLFKAPDAEALGKIAGHVIPKLGRRLFADQQRRTAAAPQRLK